MRRFLLFLKFLIIPAVIGLVIWFSDVREIYAIVVRTSLAVVAAAFALSVLAVGLNAVKWRLVIPALGIGELFKAALIGQFYSFFFLGQASGEAAKIYLISRGSCNVSNAAVSVFTDRLTSFIGMLSVSVIGFAMSSSHYPPKFQQITLAGLVLLIAGLIGLRHDAFFRWTERVVARIEGTTHGYSAALARELQNAIRQWHVAVSQLWRVVTGVSIGALVHIVNVLTLVVHAVGIGINIDIVDWCWIAGLVSIAGLIPITIGQVTAGGALVALLRLQNVSTVDALALASLVVAVTCLVAVIGSILEWHRLHARGAVPTPSATDGISNPS
jgi:uncharacterized protein (TIRG00374 family)